MIVPMKKVQIAVRQADKDRLLNALHELGVLHILPISPAQAMADEAITVRLDGLRRAVQVLRSITPAGMAPDLSVPEAADEVLDIQRRQAEWESRLASLHRQLEQQAEWGNVTLADLEALRSAGIEPLFYRVPSETAGGIRAEFVKVLGNAGEKKVLVAVIDRGGQATIPPQAESIPLPTRDNPSIRAEAAEIDLKRKVAAARLAELAHLLPQIDRLRAETEEKALFSMAARSAFHDEELFAIQGWAPADEYQTLAARLAGMDITAAVRGIDPAEDETPPTLVRYPKWARTIKGLFDILDTFPGYREIDLSAFFMIFLPIFAAMLIGDGGYGLVFILAVVLMRRKMFAKLGGEKTNLLLLFGITAFIWGILNANFFGVTPETLARAGGFLTPDDEVDWQRFYDASGGWAVAGNFMIDIAPFWREDGDASRELLIQISFLIGCMHLVLAHLRQALALWPDKRALAQVGWAIVLVSVLGIIWLMFFESESVPVPASAILGGVGMGLVLILLFGAPHPNPVKRVLIGFASSLLPLIGTFGDTMSYIRLMAVGLASYYIAVAFNSLGATIAESATWGAAVPILLFGHVLNIALCMIAIFAHGVRLNMLEFSNNAGVQWAGYPYAPFAKSRLKESG